MLLFYSCNRAVTVTDFFKTVAKDEDYKKEVIAGNFKLTSQYFPSEMICLSELMKGKSDFHFNKNEFEQELKKYNSACYFEITVQTSNRENVMMKGINNRDEYAARLGTLTYLLNRDCYLTTDEGDTVKALTTVFSNTYGNSPDVKFMIVFPKKKITNEKLNLEYDDKTFGIPEKIIFAYTTNELNKKTPEIK